MKQIPKLLTVRDLSTNDLTNLLGLASVPEIRNKYLKYCLYDACLIKALDKTTRISGDI